MSEPEPRSPLNLLGVYPSTLVRFAPMNVTANHVCAGRVRDRGVAESTYSRRRWASCCVLGRAALVTSRKFVTYARTAGSCVGSSSRLEPPPRAIAMPIARQTCDLVSPGPAGSNIGTSSGWMRALGPCRRARRVAEDALAAGARVLDLLSLTTAMASAECSTSSRNRPLRASTSAGHVGHYGNGEAYVSPWKGARPI